ncbi:MAG: hypothetical protein SGARI_005163 [Bacillariaceae sp.]
MSTQERSDLMIWLPIVILLRIRYYVWQHTPHPMVKEDVTVEDEESKDAEATDKTAAEHDSEEAPHIARSPIHTKKLPDDLVAIMIEQQVHPCQRHLSSHLRHILDSIVRRYSNSQMKSDVEALEMFSLLSGLLESRSALLAASNLRDRGFWWK